MKGLQYWYKMKDVNGIHFSDFRESLLIKLKEARNREISNLDGPQRYQIASCGPINIETMNILSAETSLLDNRFFSGFLIKSYGQPK